MARTKTRKLDGIPGVRAECFLLCDFARAENGKLYIVGGGWDQIVPRELPLEYSAYLAVKLVLPAEMLGEAIVVRIDLLNQSGQELGEPVFETTLQGTPVAKLEETEGQRVAEAAVFLGVAVQMALAAPGRFVLRLLVNEKSVAETSFLTSLATSG